MPPTDPAPSHPQDISRSELASMAHDVWADLDADISDAPGSLDPKPTIARLVVFAQAVLKRQKQATR